MTLGPIGTAAKAAFASGVGSLPWGSGNAPAAGDFVVVFGSTDDVASISSGYTNLETSEIDNGAYIWTRSCTGTSSDNITLSASDGPGVLFAQRFGPVAATPMDATDDSEGIAATTTPAQAAPSIVASVAGAGQLVVVAVSLSNLDDSPVGHGSWSNGFTSLGEIKTAGTGSVDQYLNVAYKISTGTSETTRYTWTSDDTVNQTSMWVTLTPGAAAPTNFGGGFFQML